MKNYIVPSLMCFLVGCGSSSTSGVGGGISTTGSEGSGGGTTVSISTTSSLTTSSSTVSTGGMMDGCPDPTKSWDESANYYGPVLPFPEEVPGAAAEYVWGPWQTDVKVISFTVGWSEDPLPSDIYTSIWLETEFVPALDPNDTAALTSTSDNTTSSDGFVNVRVTPIDFVVPKGQHVVTAGMYDTLEDSYASYHEPTCSDERTYYWRPVGCTLPDGTDPGPHHATLLNPLCVGAFKANWAFSIEIETL